jgi:hypothetical protein
MTKIKKLIEEYEFNGLRIKLYDEDFEHALSAHPGEVTLDAIRNCIQQPDLVIRSVQGKNACLFYEMKIQDEYFVVVVHVIESGTGEIKTAYKTTYIKNGTVLFKKENKK